MPSSSRGPKPATTPLSAWMRGWVKHERKNSLPIFLPIHSLSLLCPLVDELMENLMASTFGVGRDLCQAVNEQGVLELRHHRALLPTAVVFHHIWHHHSYPAHCPPRPPRPSNQAGYGWFGASLELRPHTATQSPWLQRPKGHEPALASVDATCTPSPFVRAPGHAPSHGSRLLTIRSARAPSRLKVGSSSMNMGGSCTASMLTEKHLLVPWRRWARPPGQAAVTMGHTHGEREWMGRDEEGGFSCKFYLASCTLARPRRHV